MFHWTFCCTWQAKYQYRPLRAMTVGLMDATKHIQTGELGQRDTQTDRQTHKQTDATKRIISPASRSINMFKKSNVKRWWLSVMSWYNSCSSLLSIHVIDHVLVLLSTISIISRLWSCEKSFIPCKYAIRNYGSAFIQAMICMRSSITVRDVIWMSANNLHLCKWTVALIQVTLSHLNI